MKLLKELPTEVLSREAEGALAVKIQKSQDDDLVNYLVLHNLREAFRYSKAVCNSAIPDDELLSLCYTSLRDAARKFKPERQRFFAFAKARVRGAVLRFWRSQDVVKNSSLHESEVPSDWDSTDPVYDGVEADVPQVFDSKGRKTKELQPSYQLPEFDAIDICERWAIVEAIFKKVFNVHEQMIMTLRYRVGLNFEEIGELFEVTRAAIQGTHRRALRKLRSALSANPQLLE